MEGELLAKLLHCLEKMAAAQLHLIQGTGAIADDLAGRSTDFGRGWIAVDQAVEDLAQARHAAGSLLAAVERIARRRAEDRT